MFGLSITTGLKSTRLAEWVRLLLWQCCNCAAKPGERHEQCKQWEFQYLLCVCMCPLNQHWTHRAVCRSEAAASTSDNAGRPEDNVVFCQQLDGNSSVCLLHPEERTQVTWSAASLHLRHRTYMHENMQTQPVQTGNLHNSYYSISPFHHSYYIFLYLDSFNCRAANIIYTTVCVIKIFWHDMRLAVQTFKINCVSRSGVCECCFFANGWLPSRMRGPPTEQLRACIAPESYLKCRKESTIYVYTHTVQSTQCTSVCKRD